MAHAMREVPTVMALKSLLILAHLGLAASLAPGAGRFFMASWRGEIKMGHGMMKWDDIGWRSDFFVRIRMSFFFFQWTWGFWHEWTCKNGDHTMTWVTTTGKSVGFFQQSLETFCCHRKTPSDSLLKIFGDFFRARLRGFTADRFSDFHQQWWEYRSSYRSVPCCSLGVDLFLGMCQPPRFSRTPWTRTRHIIGYRFRIGIMT